MSDEKEVGFKTYEWGGRVVSLRDFNSFNSPPPKPKVNKLVALYREIKSRLKGCYDILRYGVGYYD